MTWVLPKFNYNCHYKSQAEGDLTQRKKPHDDRGRDRSDVATGQQMPTTT